jgi:hypothetical protein
MAFNAATYNIVAEQLAGLIPGDKEGKARRWLTARRARPAWRQAVSAGNAQASGAQVAAFRGIFKLFPVSIRCQPLGSPAQRCAVGH